MTSYYLRTPWGRMKIEANSDVAAIEEAYRIKKEDNIDWVALYRSQTTLLFDTRPQEEDSE